MMRRVSPTIVEIDLEALRSNYRRLRSRVPGPVKTMCVVKSNAYGHGAARVSRILQDEGTDAFGVGTIDEGIDLREAGIKRPVLILLGMVAGHWESLVRYQLTPVIYDIETAKGFHQFAVRSGKKFPVHVKIDTGMTRLGVFPKDLRDLARLLKPLSSLDVAGLMTHLADASDEGFTGQQAGSFEGAKREFEEFFPAAKLYHIANSEGAISRGRVSNEETMVRLGIALYGAYPFERKKQPLPLKPVLTWKTRILSLKRVPQKTAVSYGRTFTTKKESLIGVLPVGYADGYRRLLSNRAEVLVRGKRAPVAGTICMDLTMIDVSGIPGVSAGDEAVLIGRQGADEIRAAELAKLAGTISYEIFCGISARVPRVHR